MADSNYVKFLDALINTTKLKKLQWAYLDSNKELIKGMNWCTTPLFSTIFSGEGEPTFNVEDSFYAKSENTYIVIFVSGNNPASLYVIPNTFKKIVHLSADEYGDQITRLLNLVQSLFPNAESFIDKFLQSNGIDHITEV